MWQRKLPRDHGQSLLEIVVTIGVVVILVSGLVVAAISALRFGRTARTRSQAVKFTQEGIELTRDLRNRGWAAFAAYGTISGKLWCLSKAGVWTADDGDGVCPTNIDSLFARAVLFTWNDPLMKVTVAVGWSDGASTRETKLTTYLTEWR